MKVSQLARRYVGAKIKMARFRKEFRGFVALSQNTESRFPVRWQDTQPCLTEKTDNTAFDRHYVYHPA